jgi:short-subunit dehydrogenase
MTVSPALRPFAIVTGASNGIGPELTEVRRVIDAGADMRRRGSGRILITGSIVGFVPGSFQAVYNGTKAFLNSFSFAIREELKDNGVTVTWLMPGATDTAFFERAHMMDTSVGVAEKDDPAEVARNGFAAMKRDDGDIVSGKIQSAAANIIAKQHRKMAEPGTAS